MTFYQKIYDLCKSKGINITDLAVILGLSELTYSDWKNLKEIPNNSTLQKIANYFGVTVDYLINNDTTKTDPENDNNITEYTYIPINILDKSDYFLSEKEIELVNIFKTLSITDKEKLLLFASKL